MNLLFFLSMFVCITNTAGYIQCNSYRSTICARDNRLIYFLVFRSLLEVFWSWQRTLLSGSSSNVACGALFPLPSNEWRHWRVDDVTQMTSQASIVWTGIGRSSPVTSQTVLSNDPASNSERVGDWYSMPLMNWRRRLQSILQQETFWD